ncbi:MAG: Hpt domain-containing protein [Thermodesulfobacteriota bacterium]
MAERVPINEALALEQVDGDRDFLKEMLQEFVQLTSEQLPQLVEAIAAGNSDEVRSLAHSIKGAAANLCVEKMAADAKTLEYMGRDHNLQGADELVAALRKEMAVLTSYMAGL